MRYELYYWPGIQGRGEFVRLALEEAGAAYTDVARQDESSLMRYLDAGDIAYPFAERERLACWPGDLLRGSFAVPGHRGSEVCIPALHEAPRSRLSRVDDASRSSCRQASDMGLSGFAPPTAFLYGRHFPPLSRARSVKIP